MPEKCIPFSPFKVRVKLKQQVTQPSASPERARNRCQTESQDETSDYILHDIFFHQPSNSYLAIFPPHVTVQGFGPTSEHVGTASQVI